MVDVGGEYLCRKGLTVTEYMNTIICKNVPMDEFAILLLARMFHRHFGIVLRDNVWTTGIGITIEDCSIVFAYTGDLQFMDTYEVETTPVKTANALKFTDPEQETPVNLSEPLITNQTPVLQRKQITVLQRKQITVLQRKQITVLQRKQTTVLQRKQTTVFQKKQVTVHQRKVKTVKMSNLKILKGIIHHQVVLPEDHIRGQKRIEI